MRLQLDQKDIDGFVDLLRISKLDLLKGTLGKIGISADGRMWIITDQDLPMIPLCTIAVEQGDFSYTWAPILSYNDRARIMQKMQQNFHQMIKQTA